MDRSRPVASKSTKVATSRFQSAKAKGRFQKVTRDKSFIPDKGFHADCLAPTSECDFLLPAIASLTWSHFCAPRGHPNLDLVREFYANLWNNTTTTVYVRGRMVPVSAKPIYNLFSLQTPTNDGYAAALADPNDQIFQQILQNYCSRRHSMDLLTQPTPPKLQKTRSPP